MSELFYRTFQIDRARINVEKREIDLSFSSETPVQRGHGTAEVLDHSTPGGADFSRLNAGGPLLLNHDHEKLIGAVVPGSARVDSDKVGRARVRFSKGPLAQEIWTDIADGIRNAVSVGYSLGRAVSKSVKDGLELISYSFVPHEISIVSMAADPTVGIGRSAQFEPTKNEKNSFMPTTITAVEQPPLSKQADIILQLAETYKMPIQDARAFIREGRSADDFQAHILRTRYVGTPAVQVNDLNVGLSRRELDNYSLVRAINGFAENKRFEGLEWEASRAAEKRYGRSAPGNGLIVPFDCLTHRAQTATTLTGGGYTVATDVLGANFVDLLRAKALVTQLGAKTIGGLVGDVTIPTLSSDPSASWLTETATLSDTSSTFGQILMTPHRLGSSVPISKQLLAQSSLDIEGLIRRLLATVLGQGFDLACIAGTGAAGEPLGIINTSGIGSITYGAATTWAKVVENETTLATANADQGNIAFLTSPAVRGKWKTIVKVTNQPVYLWDDSTNRVNGYAAFATSQVASDKTIFGNWSDVNIATWGDGMDLVVDPFTLAKSNQIQVTVNLHGDVSVNRPSSFVVSTDSGAQ